MTLPVSGAISFNAINVELGVAGTTQADINQASYRTLANVPGSGTTISLSNFYGKSNRVALSYTFSANTQDATLNLSGLSGYISGASDITVTINSGIYLWASVNTNAGLSITGGTTGDTLTIVNNGYIMGQGGNASSSTETAGGPALSIPINATINNTNASAYIGGGGGAGAGIWINQNSGGGGAGGGNAGGNGFLRAGGAIGASGVNGAGAASGGSGGRIFPGTGGSGRTTSTANAQLVGFGGSAGGGGGCYNGANGTSTSGNGGSANAVGNNGSSSSTSGNKTSAAGGGGGWGASGGSLAINNNVLSKSGTAGGKAVALNGKTVTWVSGNTTRVYGAVS